MARNASAITLPLPPLLLLLLLVLSAALWPLEGVRQHMWPPWLHSGRSRGGTWPLPLPPNRALPWQLWCCCGTASMITCDMFDVSPCPTAFVNGMRRGTAPEEPLALGTCIAAELAAAGEGGTGHPPRLDVQVSAGGKGQFCPTMMTG